MGEGEGREQDVTRPHHFPRKQRGRASPLFSPNSCFLPGNLNVTKRTRKIQPTKVDILIYIFLSVGIAPSNILNEVHVAQRRRRRKRHLDAMDCLVSPCVRGTCVWKRQFRQCVKSGGMQRSLITPCEED